MYKKIALLITFATIGSLSPKDIPCQKLLSNRSKLRTVLKQSPRMINAGDNEGNSLLSLSANINSQRTIKLLLAKGADVNHQNNQGQTPLMNATKLYKLKNLKTLIKSNANLNAIDKDGNTVLWYTHNTEKIKELETDLATALKQEEIYRIQRNSALLRTLALGTFFYFCHIPCKYVISFNLAPYISTILDNKIKKEKKAQIKTAELLLKNKQLNIDAQNNNDETALFSALEKQLEHHITLLLKNNSQTNYCNKDGLSPLMLTAQNGFASSTKKLLVSGANANLINTTGKTALLYAAEFGQKEIIKILLDQPSVDINHVDHQGNSAMSLAAKNRHNLVVTFLKGRGAQEQSSWIYRLFKRILFAISSLFSS